MNICIWSYTSIQNCFELQCYIHVLKAENINPFQGSKNSVGICESKPCLHF